MSDVAIRAESLGKKYLIGHQAAGRERYTALRDVVGRQVKGLVRSTRDILTGRQIIVGDEVEEFWALKDVNFEIKRGDVVGIIGRNGAGKSTMLKILSRITEPTTGRVEIRGRVASLLEVGTGFHPELTGRENIYLNGAILGMTRAEIKSKFDEIVAFAEVEKFLDTPVKRYSSGMYVRLAFAVAAHLEPEILVVDEVLAVGDAEFQKKCLGKMKDVAVRGRTVLFVSHNMAAISSLTRSAVVLKKGGLAFAGPTAEAIKSYVQLAADGGAGRETGAWGSGRHTGIREARLLDVNGQPTGQIVPGMPFQLEVEFETDGTKGLSCDLFLVDHNKAKIALGSLSHFEGQTLPAVAGSYRLSMGFAPLNLAAGQYTLDISTSIINQNWDHYVEDAVSFEVLYSNPSGQPWNFSQGFGYGSFSIPFARATRVVRIGATLEAAQ